MILGSFLASGLLRDLEILAADSHCVLWICNSDYNQQYYVSNNYRDIWERDPNELYRNPLCWVDTLNTEDAAVFYQGLVERRTLINEGYTAIYCIKLKDGQSRWVQDRSVHVAIDEHTKIIIGCAYPVDNKEQLDQQQREISDKIDLIITQYYRILSQSVSFSIESIKLKDAELLKKLSKREVQVLKLFLQGHTIAQVGTLIHLSPRTVEGHLQTLKSKLNCESKSELIMNALERNWLAINL